MSPWRPGPFGLAAAGLLLLDALARLAVGGPYVGATVLVVAACGLALVPFLPRELGSPAVRLALTPALALGAFGLVLTAISALGIPLNEISIRLAALALVAATTLVDARGRGMALEPWSRRQVGALAALAAVFVVAFAASWEIVEDFPPPGSDWAYYLHYAEEVREQERLLVENRDLPLEPDVWGNYPGLGALYGSVLLLDGISSRPLARGVAVVSALTAVSVFAATAGLWGLGAGLLASVAYAVSAIRLEPVYWHGLATTFALVFVPIVVLALGLAYRGARGRRIVGLLGFSLAGVAVAHSPSAFVIGLALALALAAGLAHALVGGSAREWLRAGSWRPLVAGAAVAAVLGAGVLVHYGRLSRAFGPVVSASVFDSDWLGLDTLSYYFGWVFLGLVVGSAAVVLASPHLRRDPALWAVAALAAAALVVGQLWRLDVAFEYRRAVYYLGVAMVMTVGAAYVALRARGPLVLALPAVALVVVAQGSIGLRLPERLLERESASSPTVEALVSLGEELERTAPSVTVVADRCLGTRARFLIGRPTLIAAEPWQVPFRNLLPAAEQAAAVVSGGSQGREAAERLGVGYVVVDPSCTPAPAPGLGGSRVLAQPELVVIRLPRT